MFAFGTLWVWYILPATPISFLLLPLLENGGIFGAISVMMIGLAVLLVLATWAFRWYFICVGLMFGRTKMAQAKEDEILRRLKSLKRPEVR